MPDEPMFPILFNDVRKYPDCPRKIPWAIIEPHRKQAKENHCGQTLERLAQRGGLDPRELRCVLEDRSLKSEFPFDDCVATDGQRTREAVDFLKKRIEEHFSKTR